MIRISIFYLNKEGSRFDTDYYINKHMPLSIEKQGNALKGVSVEIGMNGGNAQIRPLYIAMCHLLYESIDAFETAFSPHSDILMRDMINYTDIQPIYQVSEVAIYKLVGS